MTLIGHDNGVHLLHNGGAGFLTVTVILSFVLILLPTSVACMRRKLLLDGLIATYVLGQKVGRPKNSLT